MLQAAQIVEAARASNNVRNLAQHAIHGHISRVALVHMRMAGKNRVGSNAAFRASVVNIAQHCWAWRVLRASSERRMVNSENHRALKSILSIRRRLLKLGNQKVFLIL